MAGNLGNFGRSIIEGLTFNNAGETEAALRALAAQRNMSWADFQRRYRNTKRQVEGDYERWGNQHPGWKLGGELGGAIIPGVVGAFTPGGQAATVGALGRVGTIGRAMAEPVTLAVERLAPRVAKRVAATRVGRFAVPLADEMLTGVASSIGQAKTTKDIPNQTASDFLWNLGNALAVRGANVGGGKLYRAYKGRK